MDTHDNHKEIAFQVPEQADKAMLHIHFLFVYFSELQEIEFYKFLEAELVFLECEQASGIVKFTFILLDVIIVAKLIKLLNEVFCVVHFTQ